MGNIADEQKYNNDARKMLNGIRNKMIKYGSAFSNWAQLMIELSKTFYVVAITGPDSIIKLKELNQYYLTGKAVVGSTTEINFPHLESRFIEGQTVIYVCTDKSCQRPTGDVEQAIKYLK